MFRVFAVVMCAVVVVGVSGFDIDPPKMPLQWSGTFNMSALFGSQAAWAIQRTFVADMGESDPKGQQYRATLTQAIDPAPAVDDDQAFQTMINDKDGCTSFSYTPAFNHCNVTCYQGSNCPSDGGACGCSNAFDLFSIVPELVYTGNCPGNFNGAILQYFTLNFTDSSGQEMRMAYCFDDARPVYITALKVPSAPALRATGSRALATVPAAATIVNGLHARASSVVGHPMSATEMKASPHARHMMESVSDDPDAVVIVFEEYVAAQVPPSVFSPPSDCDCSA